LFFNLRYIWSAEDVTIDGKVVKDDKRRAAGVHANAAMWIVPNLFKQDAEL